MKNTDSSGDGYYIVSADDEYHEFYFVGEVSTSGYDEIEDTHC